MISPVVKNSAHNAVEHRNIHGITLHEEAVLYKNIGYEQVPFRRGVETRDAIILPRVIGESFMDVCGIYCFTKSFQ